MLLDSGWAIFQGLVGANAVLRMARGARGTSIAPVPPGTLAPGSVSVIVPVLDEAERMQPCLRNLIASGPEVGEILIVDGGSHDATLACAHAFAARDRRVRVLDAAPVPPDWNGKAWGLETGLRAAAPAATWIATIDADVRPAPGLVAAMVAHARARAVGALSVATRQELADPLQAILHPAMLATLIYRFGLPGREARHVAGVQANGQCFLARRELLLAHDAFGGARTSRCEDVTVARGLVARGVAVGFYEAGDLATVRMHESGRETWSNWPRSLTLRDRYARFGGWLGLGEVFVVQALPLPLLLATIAFHAASSATFAVAAVLLIVRAGVLAGSARAYPQRPPAYWLAPLADLPVACALFAAALRRRHVWRGRTLVSA